MKISTLDRLFVLVTCLLAAYQVAVGINGLESVPITAYTIAFGVLLVAGLLMIILGLDVLESPPVVIISTIIPLSLSLGLAWEHLRGWRVPYLGFVLLGFTAVLLTRVLRSPGRLSTIVLACVHGVAGLMIFLVPSVLASAGTMRPAFALVGVGGALIGLGGLLLSFLKAGRPILPRTVILRIFPALLMLMTAAFVAGFALGSS